MSVNIYKVKSKTYTKRVKRVPLLSIFMLLFFILYLNAIACAMCMSQDSIHYRCEYVHIFWPHFPRTKTFQLSLCPRTFQSSPHSHSDQMFHYHPPLRIVWGWCKCAVYYPSTICFFRSVDPPFSLCSFIWLCVFISMCTCIYADIYCIFQQTRTER